MYKNKSISIVVPCFNEEKQIFKVVESIPEYVDFIVIIDDKSTDGTIAIVSDLAEKDERIVLLCHELNQGVGGAIASGYKWSRDHNVDIAVVMAGDAQMDPNNMPQLLDPIASGCVDYAKGNRLKYPGAYDLIPKKRFFGNQILSFFTKIASGYWRISDAQNGYAAIGIKALRSIDWDKMYKRYGQPNDILVSLNIQNMRICDCIMKPVYGVGEESKMNIKKVFLTLPPLLFKLFLKRMFRKYVVQDFNIIAPLYFLGFLNFFLALTFLLRIFLKVSLGVPEISLMMFLYSFQMFIFLTVIAMFFDMHENEKLQTTNII